MVSVEVVFIVVWAARGYILVGREDDLIVWVVPMREPLDRTHDVQMMCK